MHYRSVRPESVHRGRLGEERLPLVVVRGYIFTMSVRLSPCWRTEVSSHGDMASRPRSPRSLPSSPSSTRAMLRALILFVLVLFTAAAGCSSATPLLEMIYSPSTSVDPPSALREMGVRCSPSATSLDSVRPSPSAWPLQAASTALLGLASTSLAVTSRTIVHVHRDLQHTAVPFSHERARLPHPLPAVLCGQSAASLVSTPPTASTSCRLHTFSMTAFSAIGIPMVDGMLQLWMLISKYPRRTPIACSTASDLSVVSDVTSCLLAFTDYMPPASFVSWSLWDLCSRGSFLSPSILRASQTAYVRAVSLGSTQLCATQSHTTGSHTTGLQL